MMRWLLAGPLFALATLAFVPNGMAQEKKDKGKKEPDLTIIDPKKGGLDYEFQGEYLSNDRKLGCQAISRGDGNLELLFLPGGLPGEGWDGKTKHRSAAKFVAVDGKAERADIVSSDGWSGAIVNTTPKMTMNAKTPQGEMFVLHKLERKSKREGAPPPKGAVVLFDDSKNLDEWRIGKLSDDGFLQKNAFTKRKFQDFVLHVEFKVPFMPKSKGQARGNSGVHPQNRCEVQILDSFGLDSKNNDCAAIYSETAPSINMCYPPLLWQTYDIDFKAPRFDKDGKVMVLPRISVLHNGVKVHDNVEIKGRQPWLPTPGEIRLSEHRNPVVYRNIWVVPGDEK